jgi:hypothetical protein
MHGGKPGGSPTATAALIRWNTLRRAAGLPLAVGAWVAEGTSPPIRVAVSEARDGD